MRSEPEPGFFGSIQRDKHLWPWFLGGGFVFFVAAAIIGSLVSHPASPGPVAPPAPSYTLDVAGTAPHVQTVGIPFNAHVFINNKGDTIQHVLMDLEGCNDHWVVDSVSVRGQTESPTSGQTYDLGQFLVGDIEQVTLVLAPKDAGNHECDLSFFKDSTDTTALDTVYWKPAINP